MAKLVLGIGVSHGPLLATPPELWHLREGADRKNKRHVFRGDVYDFDALLAARDPGFSQQSSPEQRSLRYAACQSALDALAAKLRQVRPDLVIIVGNDQREVFKNDLTGAITVFTGETIENVPLSEAELARLPPGIDIAEPGHCPPEGATYPGAAALGRHLVRSLIDQHFDVAQCERLPGGADRQSGIPHAYGFVYRRILEDAPAPSVPIFLNVGVPDNQPRTQRCLDLGRALSKAIAAFDGDARVAVIASGGLSHFVVDEALDRTVLNALQAGDETALSEIPESYFQGNTAEIKSWLPVAAAMNSVGGAMTVVDYVPCYRSEAGTGSGMGFVYWERSEQQ